jgi:hypothetical protein
MELSPGQICVSIYVYGISFTDLIHIISKAIEAHKKNYSRIPTLC